MTIAFEFDTSNLYRELDTAILSLRNNHNILTSIGLSLLNANTKRHENEQDPSGKKWTPLKPATIKRKKNPRMLVEEGDMLRFYSHVESDAVEVGTVDRKAIWHHKGTSRGLPERKLVGFEHDDQQLVKELVEDHLQVIFNRR